jgi:hypothetical protein
VVEKVEFTIIIVCSQFTEKCTRRCLVVTKWFLEDDADIARVSIGKSTRKMRKYRRYDSWRNREIEKLDWYLPLARKK